MKWILIIFFCLCESKVMAEQGSATYHFNFVQPQTAPVAMKKKDFGVRLVEFFFPKSEAPEDFARDGLFTSITARGETTAFKDISATEIGIRKSLGNHWEGSLAYFRLDMNREVNQDGDPTYTVGGVSVAIERVISVYGRWFVNPYLSFAKAQNSNFDYSGLAIGVVGEYRWRLLSAGMMIFNNTYSIHQTVTDSTLQKTNLSSLYGGARFAYFF